MKQIDKNALIDWEKYKEDVWNAPNDVVLKTEITYYWYAGQTQPTSMNSRTDVTIILSFKDELLCLFGNLLNY